MYILIRTPTSPGEPVESNTFPNVYDLLKHVTELVVSNAAESVTPEPVPAKVVNEALKRFDEPILSEETINELTNEHKENTPDIIERINERSIIMKESERPIDKSALESLHKFFLDSFCEPSDTDKADHRCWDLFANFPHTFLRLEEHKWISVLMTMPKEQLIKNPPNFHKYSILPNKFKDYKDLVAKVIMPNFSELIVEKWKDICCETLKASYANKFTPIAMDPWIERFVDENIQTQLHNEIQSSVLYDTFIQWASKRYDHLASVITIQYFSKQMKDVHKFKTHRKASGVFYMDIAKCSEKNRQNNNNQIEPKGADSRLFKNQWSNWFSVGSPEEIVSTL